MKKISLAIFGLVGLMAVSALPSFAQDDETLRAAAGDLYVISAKAGGVNYVEGEVTVRRADGTNGVLVKGDALEIGDVVTTGPRARVEVLLNPGSYARLDQNSSFEMVTTSLDDLRLSVLKGSAIFEVFADDDFKVTVSTRGAEFFLIKTGVYRVDVLDGGTGKLEVWSGRAEVDGDTEDTLKKGRYAVMNGADVTVAKFDRGDKDEFEEWSKSRAKLIAKANKKLQEKVLEDSLMRGFRSNVWDCYSSVGLWVYSTRYNVYSFLPFGYGWRSPYGYGLRTSTNICYYPDYFYNRPWGRWNRDGRGHTSGGGSTTPGGGTTAPRTPSQANIDRANRNLTPPFRRMQQSGGVEVNSRRGGGSGPVFNPGSGSSGSGGSRSSSPPPAPPSSSGGSNTSKSSGNSTTKVDH